MNDFNLQEWNNLFHEELKKNRKTGRYDDLLVKLAVCEICEDSSLDAMKTDPSIFLIDSRARMIGDLELSFFASIYISYISYGSPGNMVMYLNFLKSIGSSFDAKKLGMMNLDGNQFSDELDPIRFYECILPEESLYFLWDKQKLPDGRNGLDVINFSR